MPFELLTRRQPFVGSDFRGMSNGRLRPSEVAPLASIPVRRDESTARALAKKPAVRFASALDFDAALGAVLGEAGIDGKPHRAVASCGEAQAALAAWTSFDLREAIERAERAAQLNRAWSPLKLLIELLPEM